MKAWLPVLAAELARGPVLALSAINNLARAAVYDGEGRLLAGSLGSAETAAQAASEAAGMALGECRRIQGQTQLFLERIAPNDGAKVQFWSSAQQNQQGAWAAWLLTMPRYEGGVLKFARHLLSAFGPWTTPNLPEAYKDQWSLLPLKAGLGRLFIFGDDPLAMECAAMAARTGLTVTWLSNIGQAGPELEEARAMGDFELSPVEDWEGLTAEVLEELGVKQGVKVLVTTPEHKTLLPALQEAHPAYLALSGQAESADKPGLFKLPVTNTQKALGLIAEMLSS